jgi:hypothetical protein
MCNQRRMRPFSTCSRCRRTRANLKTAFMGEHASILARPRLDDQEYLLGAAPARPAATPARHTLYMAHKAGSVTVSDGWRPICERPLALGRDSRLGGDVGCCLVPHDSQLSESSLPYGRKERKPVGESVGKETWRRSLCSSALQEENRKSGIGARNVPRDWVDQSAGCSVQRRVGQLRPMGGIAQ